ncbi:hypothetical protein IWT25_01885 [Secundilactobacillus pentosiphilus]|uniref:D-alanyl-D-alanine carboxypeptidase n=1 Tax=Secundilactobacillus pentosiphilus TaxID=1714682 RepID=A0A1Z5IXK0_9LACO|nr:D-alanyl-D-alanine carboxypeptidase [Secundilactobacillus pentosiphilus]GAX06540.1 hypothetical protein IWT25_01885 [Secundilactobacillus pentosiphilus]
MQTKFKAALAGVAAALGAFGLSTVSANALVTPTVFKHVTQDGTFFANEYTKVTPYHLKSTKKSVYMWNDMHSKKLYNLKHYSSYTWYQLATGYKGKSKYVQVSNFPMTKRGWVWAGYLSKGYNSKHYQVVSKRYGRPTYAGEYFHVANPNKNAYLWDWSHTKIRANLKDYTNQSFYKRHSVRMAHDGKQTWYSYVDVKTKKGTVSGYVASSLLASGKTTNHANTDVVYPNDFTSTTDYLEYIKDSNYQKLTRSIMALFPNTPVDLGMSKIAANNYGDWTPLDGDDDYEPMSTSGYKGIVGFNQVSKYLYDNRNASNDTKIAGVKKLLDEAGYTQAKRDSLSGYKLGVYNINNIKLSYLNDQTPDGKMAWYGLAIGKAE